MPLTTSVSTSAGVEALRARAAGRRRQEHVAGPAAGLGQGGDPLADRAGVDAGAGRHDGPDHVVAGHEREARLTGVAVASHRLLGEGDARRLHGDERLAASRCGEVAASGPASPSGSTTPGRTTSTARTDPPVGVDGDDGEGVVRGPVDGVGVGSGVIGFSSCSAYRCKPSRINSQM